MRQTSTSRAERLLFVLGASKKDSERAREIWMGIAKGRELRGGGGGVCRWKPLSHLTDNLTHSRFSSRARLLPPLPACAWISVYAARSLQRTSPSPRDTEYVVCTLFLLPHISTNSLSSTRPPHSSYADPPHTHVILNRVAVCEISKPYPSFLYAQQRSRRCSRSLWCLDAWAPPGLS